MLLGEVVIRQREILQMAAMSFLTGDEKLTTLVLGQVFHPSMDGSALGMVPMIICLNGRVTKRGQETEGEALTPRESFRSLSKIHAECSTIN